MHSPGVFTDDLRNDLIANKCDIAVHSWKDLPLDLGSLTILAGSLKREDQRDILFIKKNRTDHIKKTNIIKILSSSPRRIYNLESFIKDYLPFDLIEKKKRGCTTRWPFWFFNNLLVEMPHTSTTATFGGLRRAVSGYSSASCTTTAGGGRCPCGCVWLTTRAAA